jgi:hypothetical protein
VNRREKLERLYLRFFAAPSDGTAVALFRFLFGALALSQSLAVWLNLYRFWGHDGMIPFEIIERDKYLFLTPFFWAPKSELVLVGHAVVFTAASVAIFLGLRARIATLVLAYMHLSLQYRNPFILNSGDRLFMIIAFLAAFMPLTQRFSVDAWLRSKKGLHPAAVNMWGQRLVAIQIAYVYLNSVTAKLSNAVWYKGVALREVLASPVFAEWPTYLEVGPLVWFLTYSTLVFELSFPLLVWFKRLRPYLLVGGILFHISIDVMMVIPIFSYIMIACYPAFLSDAEATWLLEKVFRRKLAAAAPTADDEGVAAAASSETRSP